jgi:glycosyltransferase involved in cell wall biosynthesis
MAKQINTDKMSFKPASSLVIGVGRLNRQKDFATLLRAFKIVVQSCKAELAILGEGEERASLETLIEDLHLNEQVKLYGFANNPYAIMAKASVFVLSSIYEGLPTVLIEALALGVPVVATDCKSGPKEILGKVKSGKLVRVGNVEEMAHAIIETLSGNSKKAAKQSDLNSYTVDYAVKKYLELLR